MKEKITGNLDGRNLYFKNSTLLKKFGFSRNQNLTVQMFDYKGTLGFGVTRSRKESKWKISDDPERLYLSVDLGEFSPNVSFGQMYEIKITSGKLIIHLIPEFDRGDIQTIISDGIKATDFNAKSWKSQKEFDGNTWEMYLQSTLLGLYTTAEMKFGKADKFNNLATRISEAGRLKQKPNIGVYIVWSEPIEQKRLETDILCNEMLNTLYHDGLMVFGKTTCDETFRLIGMSCHRDATGFKILREIYPDSIFTETIFQT